MKKPPSPEAGFAVLAELFPTAPSRAQRTILAIVEGAIQSYAKLGEDKTTYATIAKYSKVSRPLVQHYFKDRRDIFVLAVKYIRILFQQLVVDEMKKHSTPDKILEAYILATFLWIDNHRANAQVWQLFYFNCTLDAKMRALNTHLVMTGRHRLQELIEMGKKSGHFRTDNAPQAALVIQSLLTGALTAYGTENLTESKDAFKKTIVRSCFAYLT